MDDESKPAEISDKPKRKIPLWSKIVAGVAALIVVIVVIVLMATSGVSQVGNQFLSDIQNGRADSAYSLMTSEAKSATDKGQFRTMVDTVGPILNTTAKMTSKEAKGETGSAATGKVTYEIKGTDGITYNITINLQKEDGKWKVQNFESKQK